MSLSPKKFNPILYWEKKSARQFSSDSSKHDLFAPIDMCRRNNPTLSDAGEVTTQADIGVNVDQNGLYNLAPDAGGTSKWQKRMMLFLSFLKFAQNTQQ